MMNAANYNFESFLNFVLLLHVVGLDNNHVSMLHSTQA
jgi:hypothetical protein